MDSMPLASGLTQFLGFHVFKASPLPTISTSEETHKNTRLHHIPADFAQLGQCAISGSTDIYLRLLSSSETGICVQLIESIAYTGASVHLTVSLNSAAGRHCFHEQEGQVRGTSG